MNFLENLDETFKKKIYWAIIILMVIISIFTIYSSYSYNKEMKEQVVTVEKITGQYEVLAVKGPSPFIISVKDLDTGTTYKESFVSTTCPQFTEKAQVGTKITLVRFTNVGIEDNVKTYFFKGAYEQLCTNLNFSPKTGDNFLSFN